MGYKERIKLEQLENEVRLGIYLKVISELFEENKTYEDMKPTECISVINILAKHRKLHNRIES